MTVITNIMLKGSAINIIKHTEKVIGTCCGILKVSKCNFSTILLPVHNNNNESYIVVLRTVITNIAHLDILIL